MSTKTRYLLLACCIAIFLVAAPVMIFYVRGLTFDLQSRSFVTTGLLAVRTEPKDAQVYLNGKLARSSSGDIRFLISGSYQVTLKKPGYNDWSKRLDITAGQVAWMNPNFNAIYLLFSQPESQNIATGVSDVYNRGNSLAYLTKNNLVVGNLSNPANRVSELLPSNLDKFLASDGQNQNFLLTQNASSTQPEIWLFNFTTKKFTDLSGLLPSAADWQFGDNGQIYALSDNTLYQLDISDKTASAVFNNIRAFTWQNNSLYLIHQLAGQAAQLEVTQAPFAQTQLLPGSLPDLDGQPKLFVTFNKQIFILSDGNLYSASAAVALPLAQNVTAWSFDAQNSYLAAIGGGQFNYWDGWAGSWDFITRSFEPLSNPIIEGDIGYAFFADQNNIEAIELDATDQQNQYVLYRGTNLEKFSLDESGKNLLVLDGSQLKMLQIR